MSVVTVGRSCSSEGSKLLDTGLRLVIGFIEHF
jgi:hypothetical protein